MKPSNLLVCLVPAVAAVAVDPQQSSSAVVSSSASLPSITPPILSPESRTPSIDDYRQVAQAANNPEESSTGATKALRVRSEGTLGQTPWIGMAIGLTCTALAAVMLG